MFKILKYALFLIIVLTFISCGKDDVVKKIEKKVSNENIEDDSDTTEMTPQEEFSSAMVNDMLDVYDEDLQIYLEDEIFPVVSKSNKITIEKLSPIIYLIRYDENGLEKNILIKKFFNPSKNEFFFEKKDLKGDEIKNYK